MPRSTDRRTSSARRASWGRRARSGTGARTTLGAVLALAVVCTAAAPGVITIRRGDTLWELARTHGTSESALRELNGLLASGTLYAGRTLQLPGGTRAPTSGGGGGGGGGEGEGNHVVLAGDTLSGIAARYGTTTRALQSRNGLTGTAIFVGRSLAVPATSAPSAPSAPRAPRTEAPAVSATVAENRRVLASRPQPSRDEVRRTIGATARRLGVSPSLAVAVAYQESGFQQRVVSPVNAIGVMQVLPRTARALEQQYDVTLDLFEASDNITAGVLLLRQLQRSVGSQDRILAGYYQGAGSIARQGVLPQTEQYIRNITILKKRFPNG